MKVNTFTLIKSGFACITSDNPQYSYHLSHFISLTCFYLISILHKSQPFFRFSFYIFYNRYCDTFLLPVRATLTISIGCAPCSMCVFLVKLRSFLDNKCIIAFFLQFIFQSYRFIKRIIFSDLNCIIRILINDISLVSICNRTIQSILCIRKITV